MVNYVYEEGLERLLIWLMVLVLVLGLPVLVLTLLFSLKSGDAQLGCLLIYWYW
jgi:hypothetical protein